MTEWKQVVGYEGRYMVSSDGQVYSTYLNRPLRSWDAKGYRLVRLYDGSRPKCPRDHLVHRLVAAAFIGTDSREINHKNGIKDDNRPSNLEYTTRSENLLHAFRNGLAKRLVGEAGPGAKLTDKAVSQIRQMLDSGVTQREIAAQFGVCKMTILRIKTGRSWKHVPDEKVTIEAA